MDIFHSTVSGYAYHHYLCLACYQAYQAYKQHRLNSGDIPHGTHTLYKYGCRCIHCRAAIKAHRHVLREKREEKKATEAQS